MKETNKVINIIENLCDINGSAEMNKKRTDIVNYLKTKTINELITVENALKTEYNLNLRILSYCVETEEQIASFLAYTGFLSDSFHRLFSSEAIEENVKKILYTKVNVLTHILSSILAVYTHFKSLNTEFDLVFNQAFDIFKKLNIN